MVREVGGYHYEQWKAEQDAKARAKAARQAKIPSFGKPRTPPRLRNVEAGRAAVRQERAEQTERAPSAWERQQTDREAAQQQEAMDRREAQLDRLQAQIRQLDARVQQVRGEADRLWRQGLQHEAQGKRTTIEALRRSQRLLQEELNNLSR